MLLPNIESATIDPRKLTHYALDPGHPEGRHKARVILAALGLTVADGDWLANAIVGNLHKANATLQADTKWGRIFRVDMDIVRGQRCAKVRTGWLCTSEATRLLTCFVIGECDETA